jgi:diaminohydroxyphosphoribosylaminopyrimidine deaminase/5-amino-6-(5-phosphoribosylamino)uracil reductase
MAGLVAPNPAVGCVLVKDGRVVGRGWTGAGGRPHAETEALRRAGGQAQGAIAYVTLEPCCHYGHTPPCTEALINAGVAACVIAKVDPDQRVSGGGIARLRAAGIDCRVVSTPAVEALLEGYCRRQAAKRSWVTLKLAASLDGRIAAGNGHSQWITGPLARTYAHRLRRDHDAIVVGAGTAIQDNPALTCRLPGVTGADPVRVVLDRRLRIEADMAMFSGDTPAVIYTRQPMQQSASDAWAQRAERLSSAGVELRLISARSDDMPARAETNTADATWTLQDLAQRGANRVLVEGGGQLAATLITAGAVDELIVLRAPITIGGDGLPAIGPLGLMRVDQAPQWRQIDGFTLGPDRVDVFSPTRTIAAGAV